MNRSTRVVVPMIILALAMSARVRAAEPRTEIVAHEKAFQAAYENGETKKMKTEIAKAVSLGEKSGLATDPLMADVYMLAGVLEVDGNENPKAGVRDFVKALKIKPDVAVPKGMGTSPVKAALKQAHAELGDGPKEGLATATEAAVKPTEATQTQGDKNGNAAADKAAKQEQAKQEQAKQDEAAAKARAEAEAKQQQAKQQQAKQQQDQQEKDRLAREQRERQESAEKQQKELALAKESEGKKDKQLADAKSLVAQLEKDKAERDKQLSDAKSRIAQLEKDKADLERKRAEGDQQLSASRAQESKAREELDKIARAKQAAEAQARDAENQKKREREEREKLFAGPVMPAHLTEPLTCAVPDEAPLRTDLYVHCVPRPNVKAKSIVFYYRAGTAHYYSVPMERTSKGWYAAVVPGARVMGKVLQYYGEALDGREVVVGKNGKEGSPNILSLRAGGPRS